MTALIQVLFVLGSCAVITYAVITYAEERMDASQQAREENYWAALTRTVTRARADFGGQR